MKVKINTKEKKHTAGRPKAIIDWAVVDRLLEAGCDGVEIASYLGTHPDTLYIACKRDHKMDFSAYAQIKKARGDSLLQAKQFEIAMNGDKTMLIWLGKQRLGQREISHTTLTGANGKDLIPHPITAEELEAALKVLVESEIKLETLK